MFARVCVSGSGNNLRSFYLLLSNVLPTALILSSATFVVAQSSQPSSSPGTGTTSTPPSAQSSPSTTTANSTPNNSSSTAANTVGAPIQVTPDNATPGQADASAGEAVVANPVMKRIQRARALAAAHQLQQAANDLENVRASVTDVTLKNVTSLMLVGIYLEEGNYGRSQALLEEAFAARASQKDESLRTYFAMAGQTVNGIRSHLSRYRGFGLNPADKDLPGEANTDLDRVRSLLERVAAQAKEISNDAGRSFDAVALQEDVVGIRLSLASSNDDHDKWQTEYVVVREKLALSQAKATSLGRSSLLDAVTAKMPNPFANTSASSPQETSTTTTPAPIPIASPTGASATTEKTSEPPLISTGSLSGRESKRVTPVYPSIARSAKVSGVVRVFAIVDETGKVWVTNSEGPQLLRKAAEEAAKNWSFPPTLVSGKAVRVAGYLDFDFKM